MIDLKTIFRRQTFRKAPNQAADAKEMVLGAPAYYEVWGGLESANKALWIALWFSTTVALLALILLKVLIGRPPVVIRIDGNGSVQAATDSGAQSPVSEAEIKNFLTLFEGFFTELNFYTYDSELKSSFKMMTSDFQKTAQAMLVSNGTLDNLKANESKTTLTLTEIKIIRDAPMVLECHVKGFREIGSYKPDGKQSEVVFEDDVVLRKVPRAEQAPYGVLVEDFNESVFKR